MLARTDSRTDGQTSMAKPVCLRTLKGRCTITFGARGTKVDITEMTEVLANLSRFSKLCITSDPHIFFKDSKNRFNDHGGTFYGRHKTLVPDVVKIKKDPIDSKRNDP